MSEYESEIDKTIDSQEKYTSTEDYDEFADKNATKLKDEVPYESQIVKLNWLRVILISLFLAFFTISITMLALWIINKNKELIFSYSPWIFFIECGLFFTFGGCVGTYRQSFTISYIRNRFFKKDRITGADTKLAIGSSYTYIFAAVLLGLASYLSWIAVR